MKRLFLSMLLCFVGIATSFADEWTDENGVTWEFYPTTINDITGAKLYVMSGNTENVIVPEKVYDGAIEYDVVSLSTTQSLFVGRDDVKSIKLPSTLLYIGDSGWFDIAGEGNIKCGVFAFCRNLETVDFNGFESYVGSYAFRGCSSLINVDNLSACTSIEGYAFLRCSSLADVGDLSACKYIGDDAFSDCAFLASIGDLNACISIGSSAFSGCTSLTSIGDLNACISIGSNAFYGCTSLSSVGDLSACTSIDRYAFYGCTSLSSVGDLSACTSIGECAFFQCTSLSSIGDLNACTSIGSNAFYGCTSLSSVGDLSACTSIGNYAFNSCRSLTSVGDLSACTSIGDNAFSYCSNLTALNISLTTPPTLGGKYVFATTPITIFVPEDAVEAYRNAEYWSGWAVCIIPNNVKTDYTGVNKVMVTEQENGSGLQSAIGDKNLQYVTNLEICGRINSYDFFVMRNKMPNLHVIDMTNAEIVANAYPYYQNYNTSDNRMNGYEFYNLDKITEVKLPNTAENVGYNTLGTCRNLSSVTIGENTKWIGDHAFSDTNLKELIIPEGVTIICSYAFSGNKRLQTVQFPSTLTYIGSCAFQSCNQLNTLELPDGLQTIGSSAFNLCSSLAEVIIPGAMTNIDDRAFSGCDALKSVKTKLVDPFTIGQGTFSTWSTATLYVPMTDEWDATYNRYYWDTQWGQFAHIEGWNPTINDFYIDNDYDLEGGTIGGEGNKPDADMNHHSGFHVKNRGHQKFHHVHVKHNGSTSGSMIGDDSNLEADKLFSDIEVQANRWYFFSFPFNVKVSDIEAPGNYVFRYYDGKERAENARGGWKNLPKDQEYLEAGVGYIFQTNEAGTLVVPVENPDFATDNKQPDLQVHTSDNKQDASWNFVGNPYLSYYLLEDLDFTAPITVWTGSGYEAVRPGDDDYLIQPYQAFFVQKPSAVDLTNAGFDPDKRTTYTKGNSKKNKAKARRANAQINPERMLVNLTISDGENTDKTRVVFNDRHQMDYEMECDAAKFLADGNVPQLYTTYKNVNYAINERPNGNREVQLGFSTKKAGEFTISAVRMDTPMLLKDAKLGIIFDLCTGVYTFQAEAGTFNDRFMLIGASEADNIQGVDADADNGPVYDLNGRLMEKAQKGVQIVNGKKVLVK